MQELLREEGGYLHRSLFSNEPSAAFIDRYVAAHNALPSLTDGSEQEQRTVRIVVQRKLHALAIECALRRGPDRHLLTQKLLLVSYIAECDGEHTSAFCLSGTRLSNLLAAPVVGGSAIWRHLLGRLLVVRHALV